MAVGFKKQYKCSERFAVTPHLIGKCCVCVWGTMVLDGDQPRRANVNTAGVVVIVIVMPRQQYWSSTNG